MKEFALLVLIMGFMGVIDIKAMVKNGLKKEMIVYLVLLVIAGSLGVLFMTTPLRSSILKFLLKLFHVEW